MKQFILIILFQISVFYPYFFQSEMLAQLLVDNLDKFKMKGKFIEMYLYKEGKDYDEISPSEPKFKYESK